MSSPHRPSSPRRDRRLAQVVDHHLQVRHLLGDDRDALHMLRQGRDHVEGQPGRRQQLQPLDHLILQQPFGSASLWMRWRIPRKSGFFLKRSMARPATSGKSSGTQPTTPTDPGVGRRLLEHVLGVGVAVGRLDQHGVRDPGRRKLRLKLRRLKRPRDRPERRHQPRIRDAIQVPEVLVGVDDELGHGNYLTNENRRTRTTKQRDRRISESANELIATGILHT